MPLANKIYASHVDVVVEGADTFFPVHTVFELFHIAAYFPCQTSSTKFTMIMYQKEDKVHQEHKYLDLMHIVFERGEQRPDRTGVGTYSIFGPQLSFDVEHELPLLTTKFVGWKSIAKELLFFLKGQTNSKVLEKQGVNIWKANTSVCPEASTAGNDRSPSQMKQRCPGKGTPGVVKAQPCTSLPRAACATAAASVEEGTKNETPRHLPPRG